MCWTNDMKSAVWQKARVVEGFDAEFMRKDHCLAWIGWDSYGDHDSQYGWEVDVIDPDGGGRIENLRPLQWQNHDAKSKGEPACAVTAMGRENVPTCAAVAIHWS